MYFRVSLPKKCRTEESAKQLIKLACSIKVKKLKKYEAEFIALKEAADHAENEASEAERLRVTVARYEEERKLMMDEITQLKEMLKREVRQSEDEKKSNATVISDYKLVRQRLDTQLRTVKTELEDLKSKISTCENCGIYIKKSNKDESKSASGDQVNDEARIRELELELAQTKLAHVEAECRNQNLTHQLRATELELTTARNSWPPWLSKTLSSIKEVANKKDFPNFSVIHQNNIPHAQPQPTFISHINPARRDSMPTKNDKLNANEARRESAPVIKDSQSCSSLKSHN